MLILLSGKRATKPLNKLISVDGFDIFEYKMANLGNLGTRI